MVLGVFLNVQVSQSQYQLLYLGEGENEGWFDGWSLLVSFRKKAACLGVDYIDGSCSKINVASKVKGVTVSIIIEKT